MCNTKKDSSPKYNIDEIKQQFRSVIESSQRIYNPNLDKLFEDWEKNKKYYIDCFDGELIYQYPIKIKATLSNDNKEYQVLSFAERIGRTYENIQLEDFIVKNKEGFFNNEVIYNFSSSKGNIQKGTKLIKAFKYFEEDENTLRRIQDDASQLIQSDKLEGYLCVSVHPLDYLSSSENAHNWRSCHALDGEHRSGNLSYMADPSTVVCYLKAEDEKPFGHFNFPWNSKKWRMLLHFSDDKQLVFAGRQYPSSSEDLLKKVHELFLSEIFYEGYSSYFCCNWTNWFDGVFNTVKSNSSDDIRYLDNSYIPLEGELYKMRDVVNDYINDKGYYLHFCDVIHSSYYKPLFSTCCNKPDFNIFGNKAPSKVNIGHDVKCLNCGEEPIYNGETMMCLDCELKYGETENDDIFVCECCQSRHYIVDSHMVVDTYGDVVYICPDCFETEVFYCERCGQYYYNEEKKYDREHDCYLCSECYSYVN